ncbi:MAG: PAS domain S-box protein [Chloroherpetonaceae bacterium]|nr:PAS domain S-box protein [Chloroherpetonaceae bacterium]
MPNVALYQYVITPSGAQRFTYVSKGVEVISGVTVEELLQSPEALMQLILPESLSQLRQKSEASLHTMEAFEVEVQTRHRKTGDTHWVLLRAKPSRLENGDIVWNGVVIDITKEKEAEAALQEAYGFLQSIFYGLDFDIFVVDVLPDGEFRIAGLNPAHERSTGIPNSQLIGKTLSELNDILPPEAIAAMH